MRSAGKMAGMYELFEHTADLGMRVRAADIETLFAEAGRGLTSMFVDNPEEICAHQTEQFEIAGTDRTYLFFDWLNELLYRFESQGLLCCSFSVRITDHGLSATIGGEPVDPGRHQLSHEVKAITYHQLTVEHTGDGWLAEVIVDI